MTDAPHDERGPLDRFAVRLVPQVHEREDGTFEGSYPGMDWSVTGGTSEEVMDQFLSEDLRHKDHDPYARIEKIESVVSRHLESPIDGVQLLDRAEYDRISRGPDAEAALDRAFGGGHPDERD